MRARLESLLVGALCLAAPAKVASYDDTYGGMGYDDRPMNEDEFFGRRMQDHQNGYGLYQQPQRRGGYNLVMAGLAGVGLEWFWTGRSIGKEKKAHREKAEEIRKEWDREFEAMKNRRAASVRILVNSIEEADLALLQLLAAAEDAGVEIQNAFLGGTGGGVTIGGASGGRAAVGRGSGLDTLDYDSLDYDEFSQPDANGDNVISRMEFNYYIRQYLAANPDISVTTIPRFEDFDLDGDGYVTFQEWQAYLDRQPELQANDALAYNLHQSIHQRAQGRGARY